jgi:hypothetical protein
MGVLKMADSPDTAAEIEAASADFLATARRIAERSK